MSLLRFELRKLWRKKRMIWPLLAIILLTGVILYQNAPYQETMGDRLTGKVESYAFDADGIYVALREMEQEGGLSEAQEQQLTHVNDMATDIFEWKSAIHEENWQEAPALEHEFLTDLQLFEDAGGTFTALEGVAKEKAVTKNAWLMERGLPYEDETYPVSPALITKESTKILLGAAGVFLLILLFGNTVTAEKEQQTWLTLKTLPVSKWQRLLAKYVSMLIMVLVYVLLVLFVGWLIPYFFGNSGWNYQFPQLFIDFTEKGGVVSAISTQSYLLRVAGLFMSAAFVAFALVLFLSTRMKHSFGMLMGTGFILLMGYMVTDIYPVIQTAWNPFQFFRFSEIIAGTPTIADWLYALSAVIWSALLVGLAIMLPERERGLFKKSEQFKPFRAGGTKQRHPIRESSLFEWRKTKRHGLLRQFLLMFSLFLIVGYIVIYQQAEQKEAEYIEGMHQSIEDIDTISIPGIEDNTIARLNEELAEAEEAEDDRAVNRLHSELKSWEKDVAFFEKVKEETKVAITAVEEEDWQTFYEYQRFKSEINNGEHDSSFFLRGIQEMSDFTGKTSIDEKDWLMEHGVQPIFSGVSINTIHEDWGDKKEFQKEWEKGNRKVDDSGLFSLYLLFDYYVPYILLLLLLFLVGTGLASERGKNPTLQLLQSQPIKQRSIYAGKLVHAGIISIWSALGMFVFVAVLGTIFNRFGDWHFPILHYNSDSSVDSEGYNGFKALEGGYNFMPLGTYLVETIALFLCVIVFMIALAHLLALFRIHIFGVLAASLAIGIGGYFASMQIPEYAHYSPFTYLHVNKIANGEMATLLDNPTVTSWNGCIILAGSAVLLIIVGYVISGRKNKIRKAGDAVRKPA